MNAVFLNPVGVVGGAERVLLSTVTVLKKAVPEAKITVILLGFGPLEEEFRKRGITVFVVPLPGRMAGMGDSQFQTKSRIRRLFDFAITTTLGIPSGLLFLRRLKKLLRGLHPDFIHSNGLKTHLLLVAVRLRSVPIYWHIHDYYSHRAVMAKILRKVYKRCSAAIAISQSVMDDAKSIFPRLDTTKILNPVDTDLFSPLAVDGSDLERLAALSAAEEGTIRVGLIATFANWKGQNVFLEALALLPPSIRLRGYIIGGAIYATAGSQFSLEELKAQAARLNLGSRVGFIPFQPNPVAIYRMLDIVVHASTRPEPFGLTIAEAMSCGRPLIAARAGGAVELFEEGFDALGHTPGDASDLAAKIRELAENPSLRARIASQARKSAEAKFSTDRFGKELLDFYGKI